jgi:hypothetical protein
VICGKFAKNNRDARYVENSWQFQAHLIESSKDVAAVGNIQISQLPEIFGKFKERQTRVE